MRSLLERMKAEPLAKLNSEKEKYASTFEAVEQDLKTNKFVSDLRFGTIAELRIHGLVDEITYTSIRELFND
jgi:uncharacterized protein YecA (UPF0149 family)